MINTDWEDEHRWEGDKDIFFLSVFILPSVFIIKSLSCLPLPNPPGREADAAGGETRA